MPREKIDVERLLREKAEAQATVSAADAAIERHNNDLAARREQRELNFDRGTVAEYERRDKALMTEEAEARRAFEAALLEDGFIAAWVAQRSARWARVALNAEVQSASHRIGNDRQYAMLEPRDGRLVEEVVRVAEEAAKRQGYDRIATEITEPRDSHVYGEEQS